MRAILIVSLVGSLTMAVGKTGPVLRTPEDIAAARAKVEQFDWARQQQDQLVAACAWVLALSDQELWDYLPPPEQRRALNVSFGVGCPEHGPAVFKQGGHYPWITSSEQPFKVKCPVGGESYPSNDFQPWNPGDDPPETGPAIVDHGTGWVDAAGNRYWFVAYYVFWHRWQREIVPAIGRLGDAYLLTGDPRYAHKAAVLLARIASWWTDFVYAEQSYHNGKYPARINGRINDYIWSTGVVSGCANTYDAIFETLADDAELTDFLAGHGIPNVVETIERRLLAAQAKDIFSGMIRGNMGMHQEAMVRLAAVLQNEDPERGPTTAAVRDWLLHGEGVVEDLLWNGFYRDGHGGESSPGYSSGWCYNFYDVARLLPLIGVDIWSNPKLKKMADIGLDLTVAGEFTPDIGDSGSIFGSRRIGWGPALQATAFRQYGDPRQAQALAITGARTESLWDESLADEIAAVVAAHGQDLGLRTRVVGGYGLAVLESPVKTQRRGASIYFGHAGGGHGHRDRLTLELFGFGRPLLTDMGYPAHWLAKNTYWTSNTISHYAVVVDQQRQQTMFGGRLVSLVGGDRVQFAEVAAEKVAYPGLTDRYARATALIDLAEDSYYLVDIYRVIGGQQHDWSFHGPPFPEFETAGLDWSAPAPGTLAGPDVAFGEPVVGRVASAGLLLDPQQFEGVLNDARPYAERSTEGWAAYAAGQVLTKAVGAESTFAAHGLPVGEAWLHVRAHDYNAGQNSFQLRLGDQVTDVTYGQGGEVGWRWLPPIPITVSAAELPVTLTATEVGQSYLLLDYLVVTTDEQPPIVADLSSSGFQYLKSPQRATPAGDWSATWTKPDEDLHLRVHVPAGTAQEIYLAEAEPELKPDHPDSMEYLIGRNVSDTPGLGSTYVAVVEPAKGNFAIESVRRLELVDGPAQAVALWVEREDGSDLIYSSPEPEAPSRVTTPLGEVTCRGRFLRAEVAGGRLVAAELIDGGAVEGAGVDWTTESPAMGQVAAVDPLAGTVTLDQQMPDPAALRGRVVVFDNDSHATSYVIETAEAVDGRTVIGFGDVPTRVGVGEVSSWDSTTGTLTTETVLTGYGRVDGGRHQGRRLVNEAGELGPTIVAVGGGKITTASPAAPDFFADADGDQRARFWIQDIGPGDRWRLPEGSRRTAAPE